MKPMRIFLACADERLKIAMLMLLDHQPGMVVAGISDRLPGLLTQVQASQPDVLLLEWDASLQLIADRITNIHNLARPPVIIFLSNRAEHKETIMAAGTDYFVIKDAPPDELLTILNNLRLAETNNMEN